MSVNGKDIDGYSGATLNRNFNDTGMATHFEQSIQRPRAGSIINNSTYRNVEGSPSGVNTINPHSFQTMKTTLKSVNGPLPQDVENKQWIDTILAENRTLKMENESFSRQVKQLQDSKESLEVSHKRILRAAHEMENLLCEGAPNKHALWERSLLAEREVVDLRRQLEVYAAEVDKVRMESNRALASAEQSSFREAASVKQRDLEVMRADRAEESLKQLMGDNQRYSETVDELTEVKIALVAELETQTAVVTATAAALETSRAEIATLRAELEQTKSELSQREGELASLQTGYTSMRALAQKVQMVLAQQTREYGTLVETHTAKSANAGRALSDMREHFRGLGEHVDDLSRDAHLMKETFRSRLANIKQGFAMSKERFIAQTDDEREKEIREIQKRFTEELANVRRKAGQFNNLVGRGRGAGTHGRSDDVIINEMRQIRQGSVMKKASFNDPSHKRVRRYVQVSADHMLRWGTVDGGIKRLNKQIPLKEVIRVEYGNYSNVQLWRPNRSEHPHLCFSLVTASRSFDFIAETEWECQAWVVAISRIVSAWSSQVIKSRGDFLRRRFLLKLDFYCKEKGITRKQAIIEALRRSAQQNLGMDVKSLNITEGDDISFKKSGAQNIFNAARDARASQHAASTAAATGGAAAPKVLRQSMATSAAPTIQDSSRTEDDRFGLSEGFLQQAQQAQRPSSKRVNFTQGEF